MTSEFTLEKCQQHIDHCKSIRNQIAIYNNSFIGLQQDEAKARLLKAQTHLSEIEKEVASRKTLLGKAHVFLARDRDHLEEKTKIMVAGFDDFWFDLQQGLANSDTVRTDGKFQVLEAWEAEIDRSEIKGTFTTKVEEAWNMKDNLPKLKDWEVEIDCYEIKGAFTAGKTPGEGEGEDQAKLNKHVHFDS